MIAWDAAAAAHLLRRAGFGATPDEVRRAVRRGRGRTVDDLLGFRTSAARYRGHGDYRGVARWWIGRMLSGRTPLREKLVLFWHGHFATAASKVEDPGLLAVQNGTLRRHAAGRFRDLVVAVSRDPAMILWLDNFTNEKGSPNENFARELMELFTLGLRDRDGAANYTETDVRELARCFTGWGLSDRRFRFFPEVHDDGPKSVLGVEVPARPAADGEQDALDVIDRIVRSRACARFLVAKLWSFFAHPDPEPSLVDDLAQVYLDHDTAIRPVMRAILLRDEFHSERALSERVSPPAEYVTGTLRTLGARVRPDALPQALRNMGQDLLNPPNVAGWPGGRAWITSVTRFHRMRFAWDVAGGREAGDPYRIRLRAVLGGLPRGAGADEIVEHVLARFGVRASAETRARLVAYVEEIPAEGGGPGTFDPADPVHRGVKVRGLLGLVLTAPEAFLA